MTKKGVELDVVIPDEVLHGHFLFDSIRSLSFSLFLIFSFSSSFSSPLPSRVSQVIINLLSNSFKFTEKGNVKIELQYHPTPYPSSSSFRSPPPPSPSSSLLSSKEEGEKEEEEGEEWEWGDWGEGWGDHLVEGGKEGGGGGWEERDLGGIMSVRVTDTGIGISCEKKAQLFKVFIFLFLLFLFFLLIFFNCFMAHLSSSTFLLKAYQQVSSSRTYGGTGLGLVISRELAHLLSGNLYYIILY